MSTKKIGFLSMILLLGSMVIYSGCQGNTSGDEGLDGGLISDETTTGRINVEVVNDRLAIGGTTGFRAYAFDKNNRPVENIKISCDSERELAILEPLTGSETTSSGGDISGVIGCRAPGSYLFGCRGPVGANKRKFVTVICEGDVPAGFQGFPGAAGGGLGGGAIDPDDGDENSLRITSISAKTISGDNVTQIDTTRIICNADTPSNPTDDFLESFGDDYINVTVLNDTDDLIRFNTLSFTVTSGLSTGGTARSPNFSLVNEIKPGQSATITSLFLDAKGGQKTYGDGATFVPSSLGIRNLRVTLTGENGSGQTVTVSGSRAFSFTNIDNCGEF